MLNHSRFLSEISEIMRVHKQSTPHVDFVLVSDKYPSLCGRACSVPVLGKTYLLVHKEDMDKIKQEVQVEQPMFGIAQPMLGISAYAGIPILEDEILFDSLYMLAKPVLESVV